MESFNPSKNPENDYLVVLDDDPIVSKIIASGTGLETFKVLKTEDLFSNLNKNSSPVAVFVDIHLEKGSSGLLLIPQIKEKWPSSLVIVITADDSTPTITSSLKKDIDDIMIKPIKLPELYARLNLRLSRAKHTDPMKNIKCADISLNTLHRVIEGPDTKINVSPIEINLLKILVENLGTTVSREEIKSYCWGQTKVSQGALDRKVYEIRKVIKEMSNLLEIKTVYGKGIMLKKKAA